MTQTPPPSEMALPVAAGPPPAAFDGPRGPLITLLAKNAALSLITLGIYRFWAKTRVRVYFWQHVAIRGEPFEYTGTGRELFIGFLIVLAILLPLSVIYGVVEYLAAGAGDTAVTVVEVGYYVVIVFLVQVAFYRARRYRLSRTLWRGIRCGLTDSAVAYAMLAFGHLILVVVTLGFSYPWRRVALTSRMLNATYFGNTSFRFSGRGMDIVAQFLPVVATAWATIGLFVGLNWDAFRILRGVPDSPDVPGIEALELFAWWPLLGVIGAVFFAVRYRVREFVYFAANARLGEEIRFASRLSTTRITVLYLIYGALIALWLSAIVALSYSSFSDGPSTIVVFLILMLILFFGLPIIRVAWLNVEVLRTLCATLTIDNLTAVERIVQDSRDAPRYGEGLADALDVGGL